MRLLFNLIIQLVFSPISFDDYSKEGKQELGGFIGGVIAGIYKGIHDGVYHIHSEDKKATGRPFKSSLEMKKSFKTK